MLSRFDFYSLGTARPFCFFDGGGAGFFSIYETRFSTIFSIINQQPKLCAVFFCKLNPDLTLIKKITRTLQGGPGGNSPPKPKKSKQMEDFPFSHQILHTRRVDSPIMMWIQIRARRSVGMLPLIFFNKNGAT